MADQAENKTGPAQDWDADAVLDEEIRGWQRYLIVPPELGTQLSPHDARHLHPCKEEPPAPGEAAVLADGTTGGGTGLE